MYFKPGGRRSRIAALLTIAATLLSRWLALVTLAVLMPSRTAMAITPAMDDYAHTAWNGQRGAPADVLQFTQTKDGWLWISSPNGLFRFDGVDFERMDSVYGHRLHTTNTVALLTTRDGRLWVGGRFGGISMIAQDHSRVFNEKSGLPRGMVLTMSEAPDGSVWAATSTGLGVLKPGATRFSQIGKQQGLPETFTHQVLFGRDGRQWIALNSGIYVRDPGRALFRRAWPHINLVAMSEAPDGTLWGSDGIDKHYRVLPDAPPNNPAPHAELGGNGALFDREGNMWILKVNAVERRRAPYVGKAAGARELTRENGMSGALVQSAFEDREGNIWVGTSGGLDRLRRIRLSGVKVDTAFDHPGVIADDRGGVLISDWRRPLRRYEASGESQGLKPLSFTCAYRSPDGALWLSNAKARWRRDASGAFSQIPHPEQIVGYDAQAMTIDGRGRMWISVSRQGLFVIEDGVWRKHGGLRGMPDALALSLTTDGAGRVWAGYVDNQIALIDGERLQMFGEAEGLKLGNVQSLLVDGKQLWAGGVDGLARYDGLRWHGVTLAGRRSLRGVSGLVRTRSGDLWLNGSDGISRIANEEVDRLVRAPGRAAPFERFDALDGLVGTAEQLRPLPSITEGSDGRLWFATASDVASIDPSTIARNPLAPPVQILSLLAGDLRYEARSELRLPVGQRDLRITYTALGLAIPERLRFRYKLEGFDQHWQDVGTRREAVYTNLPPGDYQFHVIAANEDGVWNETGATLKLSLPPRFTETGWFILLMAAAALALMAGMYMLRVRQLTARVQERMQERLAERERIARGLHDTVLQSVQGLIMLFERQVRNLPISAAQRREIEQTLDLADGLLAEGRDCISDLRHDSEPGDLDHSLSQYGSVLLRHRFSSTVSGASVPLCPRLRQEVTAIAREALFNAARHSEAKQVALTIEYRDDGFALEVRDDGCGMPAAILDHGKPRHYGVVGMCERAMAAGASYTLDSAPGQGTVMRLEIPAEYAYAGRSSAALFARLRERRRAAVNAA
ncbi:two-component regulator propeller domain-containing protein [Pseudoduganella sp. S-14]|uniref:sensor histidine kinase n=1 Tax=Pseudoduganella sp. S-14 TaxID=3404065 RepID=UPI003CEE10D3